MKLIPLILALFSAFYMNAQLTYIPDDAFESYLENNIVGMSNGTSNDNYVNTSAVLMCGLIDINGTQYPVQNLAGIEEFTYLKILKLTSVPISNLDLSMIISQPWQIIVTLSPVVTNILLPSSSFGLIEITHNNQLSNVSFSANTSFAVPPSLVGPIFFSCNFNNSITSLDLSDVIINSPGQLQIIGNSTLSCINLQNGGCVMWNMVQMTSNAPSVCIQVDNPTYCSNTWNFIAPTEGNYQLNCLNCVLGIDNKNLDETLSYPNPCIDNIELVLPHEFLGKQYFVFTLDGKLIFCGEIFTQKMNIDVSQMVRGVYKLQIGENKSNTFKIVKL
jgi:hypothetical protein